MGANGLPLAIEQRRHGSGGSTIPHASQRLDGGVTAALGPWVAAMLIQPGVAVANSKRQSRRQRQTAPAAVRANTGIRVRMGLIQILDHDVPERTAKLFLQVLKLAEKAGLAKLGHVALDGAKIKANASKHKAMSYERMKTRETELRAEVDRWLEAAQAAAAACAVEFVLLRRGDEMPGWIADKQPVDFGDHPFGLNAC